MKLFKRILILALIAIAAVISITTIIKKNKEQTAQEWFDKQEPYIQSLGTFADNMDTVVIMYLSNEIKDADLVTHLRQMQGELNVMRADYEKALAESPIKIGSETYETKSGNDAIADLYNVFQNIIDMANKNYSDPQVFAYKYLAYRQNINEDLSAYLAAKIMKNEGITEENTVEEDS